MTSKHFRFLVTFFVPKYHGFGFFSECVSEGFSFMNGGLGAERCSPPIAFSVGGGEIPCVWAVCTKRVSKLSVDAPQVAGTAFC